MKSSASAVGLSRRFVSTVSVVCGSAAVAVCHVNNVFRVTVYMMSNMSSFAGRMECVTGTSVCYVSCKLNSCLRIEKPHLLSSPPTDQQP